MRLKLRRRPVTLTGPARVDRRTKNLIPRLRPGEVAFIDHENLDQVSAEGLVERGAAAVVNAAASIGGSYPNTGPLVLARAGIPLIDRAGPDLLDRVGDGDDVTIDAGRILVAGVEVAAGTLLDGPEVERLLLDARESMGAELERFAANTLSYLERERDLILRGEGVPVTRTRFAGRHALIVVRGYEYKDDLRTLRAYIGDVKPVLVAVDGAADAMLDDGLRPDVIIGDMDSVSARALTCGAELIVHAYLDGRAPGLERIHELGLQAITFQTAGTSEDIAMLLAYERGAELLVAVGAHASLQEFLDKGRGGMASTFIVRLKVGSKLVDAKGVNRLYRQGVSGGLLVLLVVAAFVAMMAALSVAPGLRLVIDNLGERFHDLWYRIRHLF
ncbi:MAG: putative cytokinetic ring protein SteA [Actinomycetota bacterium]